MLMDWTPEFWQYLDKLVATSEIVIDRPKGSHHPRMVQITYPLDCGYLAGTTTVDGSGLDIWMGTLPKNFLDALLCTVDIFKRDTEVKLLLGCTESEKQELLAFHNEGDMRAILVRRNTQ